MFRIKNKIDAGNIQSSTNKLHSGNVYLQHQIPTKNMPISIISKITIIQFCVDRRTVHMRRTR